MLRVDIDPFEIRIKVIFLNVVFDDSQYVLMPGPFEIQVLRGDSDSQAEQYRQKGK
jgi:hypothetical protein